MKNLQNTPTTHEQTPLVSIIVPIYNVESYLKECLQSIVAQSYENLDIILIDDGSDDESLKITLNFAENDERIFVVSKPNGGLSSARNFGLEFIKGSALRTFFDDGDISLSTKAQYDKVEITQNDKNQPCHNKTFSRHTELSQESEVSIQNTDNGLLNTEYQNEISVDISHSLNMTNDSKEIFHYTQNDKVKISQKDKNQDCHTERSKVSQYDKEKAFQTNTSIQSLSQTHSFEKSYKSIDTQELRAHFTQIKHNFIKSDLERINDFITQELPQNALIHFVDSDDYITQDCIEICVQALLEKDLDIVVHNIKHFYEENKSFKQGEFLQNLRQNTYESGLKLLKENKLYSFYFAWQGLFKASILNRYALRFTEGIYHEDHDFGTLLFCLAGKISYTNEPLYIYRQRANSIITAQKNTDFPSKMPSFLEPLRADFKDYKALRAYFKSYCLVIIASKIWEFYKVSENYIPSSISIIVKRSRLSKYKFFKKQIQNYIKNYILTSYYYGEKQTFYTPKIRNLLRDMGYGSLRIGYFRIYYHLRIIWRHPFKFIKKNYAKKSKQ